MNVGSRRWIRLRRLALGLCGLALACDSGMPDTVFVPGTDFGQRLTASLDLEPGSTIRVGEPVRLLATRETGPWVEVASRSLPEGDCWLTRPPAPVEPDVASNVRWDVDPPGMARFDVGHGAIRTRTVAFEKAGRYRLQATSASWCGEPFPAAPIEIEVLPRGS